MARRNQLVPLCLTLVLGACDYGPAVDGGQPTIAFEVYSTGRRTAAPASRHYYEISRTAVEHLDQLEIYFRWRCRETYLPEHCTIYAWTSGMAPHHAPPFLEYERAEEILRYDLDRGTGKEQFTVYSATVRPPIN